MNQYDRQYRPDGYGRPRYEPRQPSFGYGSDFEEQRTRPRPGRVTASYNRDYTWPRPAPPRFNPNRFGGDYQDRIGDMRSYRKPYMTRGGTWTGRGSMRPPPYDRPDYGPNYGGRYPDEL